MPSSAKKKSCLGSMVRSRPASPPPIPPGLPHPGSRISVAWSTGWYDGVVAKHTVELDGKSSIVAYTAIDYDDGTTSAHILEDLEFKLLDGAPDKSPLAAPSDACDECDDAADAAEREKPSNTAPAGDGPSSSAAATAADHATAAAQVDCGTCSNCLDKVKFGGPGIKRKRCVSISIGASFQAQVRSRAKAHVDAPSTAVDTTPSAPAACAPATAVVPQMSAVTTEISLPGHVEDDVWQVESLLAWKRLTLHASAHHGDSPAPPVLALARKRSRRKPRAPSDVGLGLLALVC